ncbi:MAG: LysR substrate-binding domain-containing protein [Pseudomonadota bacterium]
MDTRRLRYFVQIVDCGSITRAAALSGVAQPALSQQLAILENELKVKLLERSVSGVKLTPAGRVLYVRAQSILRQFDELREAVHREVKPLSGTVVLGISPTMFSRFGLSLIERVCTQHPEMHLQFREEGSVVLDELLSNGKIELSISPTRPDGNVIVGEEILSEPLVLSYPGTWDLREDASLEELAALPWVVPRRPNSIRTRVDAVFAAANLSPRVVVEIDSLHSALETVRRGVAVAAMPIGVIRDDIAQGIVKARHIGDVPLMRPMYLSHRRSPALTPAAQFVCDILRDLATEWRLEASGTETPARDQETPVARRKTATSAGGAR